MTSKTLSKHTLDHGNKGIDLMPSEARGHDENDKFLGFFRSWDPKLGMDFRVSYFISMLRFCANLNLQKENNPYIPSRMITIQYPYGDSNGITALNEIIKNGMNGEYHQHLPKSQKDQLQKFSKVNATPVMIEKLRIGNVHLGNLPYTMKKQSPLYPEWAEFFCELFNRLTKENKSHLGDIYKRIGEELDSDALKFIRELYSTIAPTNKPEYNFAVAVVQTFLQKLYIKDSDGKNVDILLTPSEWANATHGQYKDRFDLVVDIFPPLEAQSFKTMHLALSEVSVVSNGKTTTINATGVHSIPTEADARSDESSATSRTEEGESTYNPPKSYGKSGSFTSFSPQKSSVKLSTRPKVKIGKKPSSGTYPTEELTGVAGLGKVSSSLEAAADASASITPTLPKVFTKSDLIARKYYNMQTGGGAFDQAIINGWEAKGFESPGEYQLATGKNIAATEFHAQLNAITSPEDQATYLGFKDVAELKEAFRAGHKTALDMQHAKPSSSIPAGSASLPAASEGLFSSTWNSAKKVAISAQKSAQRRAASIFGETPTSGAVFELAGADSSHSGSHTAVSGLPSDSSESSSSSSDSPGGDAELPSARGPEPSAHHPDPSTQKGFLHRVRNGLRRGVRKAGRVVATPFVYVAGKGVESYFSRQDMSVLASRIRTAPDKDGYHRGFFLVEDAMKPDAFLDGVTINNEEGKTISVKDHVTRKGDPTLVDAEDQVIHTIAGSHAIGMNLMNGIMQEPMLMSNDSEVKHRVTDAFPMFELLTSECDGYLRQSSGQRVFNTDHLERFYGKRVEKFMKEAEHFAKKQLHDISEEIHGGEDMQDELLDKIDKLTQSQQSKKYTYSRDKDGVLFVTNTYTHKKVRAVDSATTSAHICKNSGITAILDEKGDDTNCAEFFNFCIDGKDSEGCTKFLKHSHFWIENINYFMTNANLYIASNALRKFGIKTKTKGGITTFVSVDEWLATLSGSNKKAISQNEHLIALLKRVIEEINKTSIILNRNELIPSNNTQSKLSPLGQYIIKRQLSKDTSSNESSEPTTTFEDLSEKYTTDVNAEGSAILDTLQEGLTNAAQTMKKKQVSFVVGTKTQSKYYQIGGGGNENFDITSHEAYTILQSLRERIKNLDTAISLKFKNVLEGDLKALQAKNRKLSDANTTLLHKSINNMNKTELAYLKISYAVQLFLVFFHSEIRGFILNLDSGDTNNNLRLKILADRVEFTIKQMFEMIKIARTKLKKYCAPNGTVNKMGKICDELTFNLLTYDMSTEQKKLSFD